MIEYIFVFILGACIGSFLNVCIYRIPLGKSIVSPGSYCPSCRNSISPYHNIPLLSYICLQGRCHCCRVRIPVRYFMVELFTALVFIGLFFYFSFSPAFFMYAAFVSALIVISFIDAEHQEIPDVIDLPGILIGILAMTLFRLDASETYLGSFLNSISGIIAGGGSMFLLGTAGEFIFKKEALGGGDIKLMAMIGAFLGWKLTVLTFFLSPFFGSVVGIFMRIKYKKEVIPYGPYLAMGAVISLLYGNKILGFIFPF